AAFGSSATLNCVIAAAALCGIADSAPGGRDRIIPKSAIDVNAVDLPPKNAGLVAIEVDDGLTCADLARGKEDGVIAPGADDGEDALGKGDGGEKKADFELLGEGQTNRG